MRDSKILQENQLQDFLTRHLIYLLQIFLVTARFSSYYLFNALGINSLAFTSYFISFAIFYVLLHFIC